MRTILSALPLFFAATAAAAQAPAPPPTVDISAEDIAATVRRTAERTVSDQAIRVVDMGGYQVGVGVVHRSPGNQGAIEHSKITEIYHVMEGAGTLVTGGTIPDARPSPPESQVVTVLNGPSNGGQTIQGGQSRRIKAGDVVIIPPNTPHWFSAIEAPQIVYLVVRVDPEKVIRPL